jgi:PAS domain S-box-containing protein
MPPPRLPAAMPDPASRPSPDPDRGSPRRAVDYYAQAFRSSPVVTILARVADGQIIDANEAFYRTTGHTRPEVVGRTTIELGLWPDPARRAAVIAELSTRGCVRDFEAEFLTKSGQTRFVLLNGDIIDLDGVACMLITAVDLTERRRREQVQNATYTIAQAALAGHDLNHLWAELHRIVASLMSARNFYVALLSPDGSLLSFPYYVDETVSPPGAAQTGLRADRVRPALRPRPAHHR